MVTVMATDATEDFKKEYLIDPTRFSNLKKLLRVTGWVLRFVKKLKEAKGRKRRRAPHKRGAANGSTVNVLTASELKNAKMLWEKDVQQRHFPGVIASGGKDRSLPEITWPSFHRR